MASRHRARTRTYPLVLSAVSIAVRRSIVRQPTFGLVAAAGFAATFFAIIGMARAEEPYPWCAVYGGGFNGTGASNCGFVTIEQCRATVSGLGGFCATNPMYPGPEKSAVKRTHAHARG